MGDDAVRAVFRVVVLLAGADALVYQLRLLVEGWTR